MGVFAYPWVLCLFLEVLLLYLLHVGLQITCNCCVCVCVCVNEMRRKSSLTCFQIYMLLLQQNLLERITFSTCALLQHIFCKPGGCDYRLQPWASRSLVQWTCLRELHRLQCLPPIFLRSMGLAVLSRSPEPGWRPAWALPQFFPLR